MNASANYSALIRINAAYEDDGRWTLTSADLPGFLMRGTNRDSLLLSAPKVIEKFFELNFKILVQVLPAISAEELLHANTNIPTEVSAFTALPVAA